MLLAALLLLGAWGTSAPAQQVTLDVAPRTLRLNETATLKLTFINMNPPQSPSLPEIPGFQISYIGQEQHFEMSNAGQTRRLTFNYRLQPLATGQFRLGPFSLNFAGQNVDFEAIMLEVLPPSASASGGSDAETIDDLVFARMVLPRPVVYLQERFDVELHLYFRGVQIDRGVQLQNMPSTGISLDDYQELGATREAVSNEVYEVRRFRMRGTAMTAGSFQLDPMLRVNILVPRNRSRDPFFGGFDDVFFGRYEAQPLTVPVRPETVEVKPLPADGRPDNFSGAVGVFSMDVSRQPGEVTAGDPVTLTIQITGRGNMDTLSMPKVDLGDDFRPYDPKLVSIGPDHKTFEQVIIPRHERITEIPAVTFSYFDPQQGAYQTLLRGPIPLVVKAGASGPQQLVQAPSASTASDRAPLGIDILGPKSKPAAWHAGRTLTSALRAPSPAHLTPMAVLAVVAGYRYRRNRLENDVGRRRRSMAPSSARASIKQASAALARGDSVAFHQAIWKAIADYTAHRCNLEAGEVSPDQIRAITARGGLPAKERDDLMAILAACDEARFARLDIAPDPALLQARLQRIQEILRACERIPFR